MSGYSFELITGPMSCGKTEELLRRIRRCIIAKKKIKIFSPLIDTRANGDYIESRNGLWLDAVKVHSSLEIAVREIIVHLILINSIQVFRWLR